MCISLVLFLVIMHPFVIPPKLLNLFDHQLDLLTHHTCLPHIQLQPFEIPTLHFRSKTLLTPTPPLFPFPPQNQDLCYAALSFANDTLKPGGHFVCKFYQGSEDKKLENMLKKLFTKVHRDKPDSSRSVSLPFSSFLTVSLLSLVWTAQDNFWVIVIWMADEV